MSWLMRKWAVLSIGILFHLAFLWSIFDIYFVSPLVHGMRHYNPLLEAAATFESTPELASQTPAKRLFLVVGDGLRADKCFEKVYHPAEQKHMYLAPYIRSKVLNEGTFGISHTRMPTESRPGHVAMIAGFYEDVSAVTKGWQENPVDFDSVFNQSRRTWSYGSPDILPMFAKGAEDNRVNMVTYDHTFEDFTKSSIDLDSFVFDNVFDLFKSAKSDPTVANQLNQNGLVFFLHLLGIDTAGHGYRPYSAEYYDNVRYIDGKIAELETMVNSYYDNDGETAWVFTADHGMSDFGSHGDGHPNNTRTPLVAWGAGLNTPIEGLHGHDTETTEWELPVVRNDVNQADIASLMAYLIGANYPANSVGELPLAFLKAEPSAKSRALAANAYSIAEQYLVKERHVIRSQLKYKPMLGLSGNASVADRRNEIEALIAAESYDEAMDRADELMKLSLGGLRYLQTYNWMLLRSLVTLGFLGWITYSLTSFLYLFVVSNSIKAVPGPSWATPVAVSILAVLCGLLYKQDSPWNYYFYAFFPVFFWHTVLQHAQTVTSGIRLLVAPPGSSNKSVLIKFAATVVGFLVVETIVYGYFHREVFSVLLIFLMLPSPWLLNWDTALANWKLSGLWSIACFALSLFTVQPVVKTENLDLTLGAAALMTVLSLAYIIHLNSVLKLGGITMVTCGVQIGLIVLSAIVTRSSSLSLQARKGLPIGSQLVGWMTIACSLLAPFMHSLAPVSDFRFQFLSIFMVFCPTMVILTISYEGYFYVAFALLLYSWFELERRSSSGSRSLVFGDFRLALVFLIFAHIAFFGTGNVASLSSFSLDSVYRLIPIFNPFAMGALLIFKLLVPFVLLSVALGIVNRAILLPSYAIFAMVLPISDILSLNFFFLVVDEGSWLDIGTGISHFCICSLLCLFVIFLEYLSSLLVGEAPKSSPRAKSVLPPKEKLR